jgi:uncharacterized protein (TIGR03083 family)
VTSRGFDEHVSDLREAGELLATAVERVDPDDRVPSCPEWTVRELARHTGGVHRWATLNITRGRPDPVENDLDAIVGSWPADDELATWLRAGVTSLADALVAAAPDLECFTFLPAPSPRAFWARRQAHETTMHRVDAEQAGGAMTPIDPGLAADGIGELLFGFASRPRKLLGDDERVLQLRAVDTGDDWTVRIGPDGGGVSTDVPPCADCHLVAPAADVYLLLWNRRDSRGLDVEGDPAVLDDWSERVRVRWS